MIVVRVSCRRANYVIRRALGGEIIMAQEQPGRVIILDDDPVFCALFSAHAKAKGIEIEAVSDSENLFSCIGLTNYSLVMVDYDLNDETGLEVAATLKQKYPDLPILVVSATNRPWQAEHADLTNIRGQVSKWDGYDKLCATIMDGARGIFDSSSLKLMEEELVVLERDYNVHLWIDRDKESWTQHYHSFAAY